jgi:hypothetical protein
MTTVTFKDSLNHIVTKTITTTGVAQAVTLTAADVLTLTDGAITVSATATDAFGTSPLGTTTFTLDRAVATPTLALGTNVLGGATSTEAQQGTGVVTVIAESGATTVVTFTNGVHTVIKTVTGTGSALGVVLAAGDLTTLTNGTINVSAVATDTAGNISSAGTTSFTLDTVAPLSPSMLLLSDTGTAGDGKTNVATVNVNGVDAGNTWEYSSNNGISWNAGTNSSFSLLSDGAAHTYSVHQIDAAGNVSLPSTGVSYTLDTTAPTLTMSSGVSTAYGAVIETFTFSEAVTGFSASSITLSAGATPGVFTAIDSSHYSMVVTFPAGTGSFTVDVAANAATDIAGNQSLAATQFTQNYAPLPATISLGTGNGQLIAPIQVSGNWYYFWDKSGNGSVDAADRLASHDTLDTIFNHDINGVANTTVANADGNYGTTGVYHYGTINGVKLSLPLISSSFSQAMVGTYPLGTTMFHNTTSVNSSYSDLFAIWDSFNGSGNEYNTVGMPPFWGGGELLWSATQTTLGHGVMNLYRGSVYDFSDITSTGPYGVALQVL